MIQAQNEGRGSMSGRGGSGGFEPGPGEHLACEIDELIHRKRAGEEANRLGSEGIGVRTGSQVSE